MDDLSTSLKNSDQSATDPMKIFADWLQRAEKTEPNDPSAMALATVDAEGMPNVRMVLMRRFDEKGIVFFTNFDSQKGGEILTNHKAAACFHWKSQRKSVRFRGMVEEASALSGAIRFWQDGGKRGA